MKYREYPKCGIHSRLQLIINRTGGYSIDNAARALMKSYNINDKDVAMELAKKGPDIWRVLESKSPSDLEEIYSKARRKIESDKVYLASALDFLYKNLPKGLL